MSDLPSPKKHKTSNWSAIWVLPLVALAIGAWLGWRAYDQAGVLIQVRFESSDGIQAKKTEVLYKGIAVGKVVALDVSEDIKGVVATIEMDKEARQYLSKGTRFWLVKPRVSLAGVTGLETLVSGVYIAVDPVKGEKEERNFTALKQPPPLSDRLPGLHLTLKADRLGSLEQGSPVFYRQIQVGQVKSFQLGDDQRTIEIKVHIEPAYADLVRKHTRFWNASGISISGGLSGFKVRSESLLTLAAGGIAFATSDSRGDSPPTDPSKPFRLYDDYDAAQAGLRVKLKMNDVSGIDPGRTPVMFNGVQVGLVKSIDMDKDYSSATADLAMDPRVEDMLLEGTEFWTVKPSISLAGITGLEALVKGNYIDVRFAKSGAPSREFTIRPKAPPLNTDAPGLHLVLTSDKLGSIDIGAPILYRQVRVGSVQSYQLSRDRQRVVVGVHIEPEYAHLVNTSTRFWNSSGITLTGNLSGVQVKSESLQTLITGGISFDTLDPKAPTVTKVRRFTLFDSEPLTGNLSGVQVKSESLQTLITGGISFDTLDPKAPTVTKVRRFTLFDSEEAAMARGVEIQLSIDNADGLREGTPIRFKGLDIGKIESVELNPDLSGVLMKARLTSAGERVARSGTRFWVVRPALGLLRTENLGTLVSGPYIEALPSSTPGERQARFQTLAEAPNLLGRESGLRLTLSAPRKGSIKPGNLVTYRQIPVGKVVDLALGEQADRVLISILIEPRYVPLVRTGSRFWNASGFGVDASLFKGLSLRTESMEALMEGGIAFATPNNAQMGEPAKPGQTFALFDSANDEWLEWAPKIPLKETARR
ncbi:PqiB family protein [Pseudomonas aeruginosa]|uniref:PqiB family protein n=107 Tax=Pseudomonas TaxID=286 RepID=UPI0010672872|nr:MlaD family protein [Pseudomonas aeruginosa]TEI68705.1 MCE family protein [Pseudomonas aeruginosa]